MENVLKFKGLSEVGAFPSGDGRDALYMTPEGKVCIGVIIRREKETFTVCNCEDNKLEKVNEDSLWLISKEQSENSKVIDIISEMIFVLDSVASYIVDHKVSCRVAIAILQGKHPASSIDLASCLLIYNYFKYGLSIKETSLEIAEIEYTLCDIISSRLSEIITKIAKRKKKQA